MQSSTTTPNAARCRTWVAGAASPGSGAVRWMPSGPTSKIHASTMATGKPTSRNTTTKVIAHSGTCSAGKTTEQPSVTPQATAP